MSNLIKADYFNLSTMLNLKILWMYQLNTSKPEHTSKNKGSMNFEWSSYVQMEIGELGVTNLSALTTCMYDGCLDIIAVVVWSYLNVDESSIFYASWSRGGHMDHADSADSKAGSHIRLVCRTLGLGGMLHWHGDWRSKIRLLSCVQVSAKWTGVAKP